MHSALPPIWQDLCLHDARAFVRRTGQRDAESVQNEYARQCGRHLQECRGSACARQSWATSCSQAHPTLSDQAFA